MKSFRQMTDDEFRSNVRMASHMFAVRHFAQENPDASRADAWQYATRNWQQFTEKALDWMALCEADKEARAQSHLN